MVLVPHIAEADQSDIFDFFCLLVGACSGYRDSLLYRKVHSRAGKRKHRGFPHPPKGFLRRHTLRAE